MKFHTIITVFRNTLGNSEPKEKISKVSIERFYETLNNSKFNSLFFSKYYQKYIANLNRLRPSAEDEDPDLSLLRLALAKNKWKPTKPSAILLHLIKYEYKLTSVPFIFIQKRKNRKKLNKSGAHLQHHKKQNSSKEWIKVPISRNNTKS